MSALPVAIGEQPTSRQVIENVENDPKRRFADVNYRIAKGLLDHLISDREQLGGIVILIPFPIIALWLSSRM